MSEGVVVLVTYGERSGVVGGEWEWDNEWDKEDGAGLWREGGCSDSAELCRLAAFW